MKQWPFLPRLSFVKKGRGVYFLCPHTLPASSVTFLYWKISLLTLCKLYILSHYFFAEVAYRHHLAVIMHCTCLWFCKVAGVRTKLNTFVQFPVTALDMSKHVENPTSTESHASRSPAPFIYDLYAVCNHYGNLQGGHYTGGYCAHCIQCGVLFYLLTSRVS